MVRYPIILILAFFIQSCKQENLVYADYQNLNNGFWRANDTIRFSFSEIDTLSQHNIFINIRNNGDYKFSNIFLIAEFGFPEGETVIDTLEYEMALPDGTWLGKGRGSVKESKFWFRENIVFPDSGVYSFKVSHAMRENGEVDGVQELKGITDVGLQIEKRQ